MIVSALVTGTRTDVSTAVILASWDMGCEQTLLRRWADRAQEAMASAGPRIILDAWKETFSQPVLTFLIVFTVCTEVYIRSLWHILDMDARGQPQSCIVSFIQEFPPLLDGFLTGSPSRLGGWLAVQSQRSACFCFFSTGIVDVGHQAVFLWVFGLKPKSSCLLAKQFLLARPSIYLVSSAFFKNCYMYVVVLPTCMVVHWMLV